MLHIITALYRYENLPKIYSSILISDKITWHISKISSKPDPEYDFIKKDFNMIFIDLEKEYDRVIKNLIWQVLDKRNIVGGILILLEICMKELSLLLK